MLARLSLPSNINTNFVRKDGCTIRPVNASVAAKHASKMLALLWSLGLLFTAMITNTLSRTVKGQVMLIMMMLTIKLISTWAFLH